MIRLKKIVYDFLDIQKPAEEERVDLELLARQNEFGTFLISVLSLLLLGILLNLLMA